MPELEQGRKLGRYLIEGLLGRGGMGEVYRAKDETLLREVAIKVIRLDLDVANQVEIRERLRREALVLARLDHPGILSVYDFGTDGDLTWIVTQLGTGGNLRDRMAGGPLSLTAAGDIVSGLAGALDYMHGMGFVHRDLKPDNVLLGPRGEPIIADLGIAKILEEAEAERATQAGGFVGSLRYAPPEAFDSARVQVVPQYDIYSLGVMAYEMLAGRPPFDADGFVQIVQAHLTHEPPSLRSLRPELPASVESAVMRALAKKPEDRPGTAGEFADMFLGGPAPQTTRTTFEPARAVLSGGAPTPMPTMLISAPARSPSIRLMPILAGLGAVGGLLLIIYFGTSRGIRSVGPIELLVLAGLGGLLYYLYRRSRRRTDFKRSVSLFVDSAVRPDNATVIEPMPPQKAAPVPPPPPPPPAPAPQAAASSDNTVLMPSSPGAMPAARVVVSQCTEPTLAGCSYVISRVPFSIGRSDQDLSVASDYGMSRRHAEINFDPVRRMFVLRDGGSTNGTYLNGRRIAQAVEPLYFGDSIRLSAGTVLTFLSGSSAQLPDLTGKALAGRFRLVRLLKDSPESALYEGQDEHLPRKVAVKILSPQFSEYAGHVEEFEREARFAARLNHPHLCKVLDFGESLGYHYLCMELMSRGSLSRVIEERKQIPRAQALDWIRMIAAALDYIHRQGVVHSGLKPSAVVFDEEENAYLTDFALALSGSDAARHMLVGAPAFLGPEQWDQKPSTPATDQFALAVMAYLLLAGARPFEGQDNPDVRRRNFASGPAPAHQEAARQGLPVMPQAVSAVLQKGLSVAPAERYESCGKFVQSLHSSFEDSGAGRAPGEPRVFISYQRDASAGWAVLFSRDLKDKYQVTAFVDTQRLDSAVRFPARLQQAIENCDVFVCFLAAPTLNSAWVKEEIRLAHQHNKPMVPVFQESYELPPADAAVEPHIAALLAYDGVHLLDRKNIHIEHTIADLAGIVKRTVTN